MKSLLTVLPEVPDDLEEFTISDEAVRLLGGYFVRELLIFIATKGSTLTDYRGHSKLDVSTIECLMTFTDFDIKEIYEEKPYFYEAVTRGMLHPISGRELRNTEEVERVTNITWRIFQDWGATPVDAPTSDLVLRFVTHTLKQVVIEAASYASYFGRETIELFDLFSVSDILPWPLDKWLC